MKMRGPYDERLDTPPIVAEYKAAKLARARQRWRAYKYLTYAVTVGAAAAVLLDDSMGSQEGIQASTSGLGGIHRLKRDVLEAWASDEPLVPVLSSALLWKEVTQEYPHFTAAELRYIERRLIADGKLQEDDLTPLPQGVQEEDFAEKRS